MDQFHGDVVGGIKGAVGDKDVQQVGGYGGLFQGTKQEKTQI